MWLLLALSKLFRSLAGTFGLPVTKAIQDIDLTDVFQFRKIAEVTVDLSTDMYCNTLDQEGCGHNYFKFLTHPRYNGQPYTGKTVKEFGASVKRHLPKTLVWDWDGDPQGSGVPPVRIIAMRGTHSAEEWAGNFDCVEVTSESIGITPPINGRFHRDFGKAGWTLWKNLKTYIQNSDRPVIITGHSRGGGLAQVLHVIAKKNTPNVPIYTFSYAAPPTMALTNADALTKDIYGFVFRNDGIPRFFVNDIINTFCKASLVCDFAQDLIDYVKDDCVVVFGGTICKDSPWPAAILTIASRFLLPYVSKKAKTYAVDGLKSKMSVLTSIFTNYRENRKSVRITDHVGKIYLLDWINTNSSIEGKNEMVGCVREQLQLDMLRSPDDLLKFSEMNFGQLASLLKDHDPRPYQHAIHDPVCVSLDDVAQFSTDSTDINPYSINYRRIVSLEEPPDTLPEIKYPEWMPDISNEDDCVFCDTSCIEAMPGGVGNGTCMSEFTWDNMDENWTCEGIMIDCNQSYIVAATCTNETHICSFNSTSGQDQCQPLPVINPPKEPRNRCMSEPGDDCYYMSKYYNDSSSGSSCNRNKHSSSDSSNGQSSSGSSNTGVSSLTLSNKQFCDDPKSCATDLADFVVNSVYLGGNAIIPFEPGYSFMKGARRTLGRVVPPPNFQHTAVWFSDSDNAGDDSIGAILVYGEYYNLNGDPTYLGCDGARSFVMTLGEFKNMFRAFEVKKMKTGRNITLTTLLDESKRSGSWDADSYNWATNNCQHFSASVLKILEAKRADAKPEDWAEIPPPVMNSILITELTY